MRNSGRFRCLPERLGSSALGPATSGTAATVDIYTGQGRMWGADFDPADGFTELAYDLKRDLLTPAIQCPSFTNNAQ